ncbi:MAG: hypothetical protein QOH03_2911 [Kribbellaceae bacterium]|jgi:hypothetical protein|nr:hypothetical protein [Kribbellaceae bacterium]
MTLTGADLKTDLDYTVEDLTQELNLPACFGLGTGGS